MKKCPKCGASVDSSSKFCTNCGYSFIKENQDQMNNQQSNTQENINRNVESVKKYSNGYFSWFMKTIKKPSENIENTHTYYGLTSFIISAILIAFSLFHSNSVIFDKLNDLKDLDKLSDNSTASIFSGFINNFINLISDNLQLSFIRSLLLIFILMIAWLLIGFFAKKISSNHVDIFNYLNELAGYTNYVIIVDLILLIISLITNGSIDSFRNFIFMGIIMTIFIPIIYNIGLSLVIFRNLQNKIDKLYVLLGAIIIDLIVAYEIIKLFF